MNTYADLCRLTEAAYQADLANLRRLTLAEDRIRNTLSDLDRQARDSHGALDGMPADWRAVGADQAWRKWLTRQRAEANMQLARVLAEKADALERLRHSFARRQVSEEILELQNETARRDRAKQY